MNRQARSGLAVLAIIAVFAILEFVELPSHTHLWREIHNSGHAPLFGMMSLAILTLSWQFLRGRFSDRLTHYAIAFALTVSIGAGTELVQLFGPRDADLYDLLLDMLGSAGFLGIYLTFDNCLSDLHMRLRSIGKTVVRLVSLTLLFGAVLSPLLWGVTYLHRAQVFPLLCGFESVWETNLVDLDNAQLSAVPSPSGWTTSGGEMVAMLKIQPAKYAGFSLSEPFPDWRGYTDLRFEIYSELDSTIAALLRVHDSWHNNEYNDRFNQILEIKEGLNRFQIPLERIRTAPTKRRLGLGKIAGLQLYILNPTRELTLYVDDLRLE